MVRRSVVAGCGSYLPERKVTNEELAKTVDTSHDWIVQRTGIHSRHIAADGEKTSDLALAASLDALEDASIGAADVDMIVLATATPDETFPSTATAVQAALGMTRGAAFDVQAVCSGFVYATNVADNFIRLGQADNVLVIGAETFSRILDWEDRTTCVLFGDGAGAVVLQGQDGDGSSDDRGILSNCLHSDGQHHDLLYVDGGTLVDAVRRLSSDGRPRSFQARRQKSRERMLGGAGCCRPHGRGHKLVGATPGKPADYFDDCQKAQNERRQDCHDSRSSRQYVGRVDPAGPDRSCQGWPRFRE